MPEINDRMTTTLEALRSDVERTPLADSLAVRRRGDQRTRRQAVGAALVAVALVAGAVGYLTGGLTSDDKSVGPPASGGPTASTSVETPLQLAIDPFLRESDVSEVGPYQLFRSPASPSQRLLQCMPNPSDLGATEGKGQFFFSDLDATFTEHVLRFDTTEQASTAAGTLGQAFQNCPKGDPADATVVDRGPEIVSSVAVHASRLTTPKVASEQHYYELGFAQDRNVLVILQWSSMGNPFGKGSTDWVWTAARVGTALDRAVD